MPGHLKASWFVRENKFGEYKRRVHLGMEKAAIRAQNKAVAKAREVASERTRTGAMVQGIQGATIVTPAGVKVLLRDDVWYAHFQDKGTKRGVSPLHFMEAGANEARREVLADMAEEIGSHGL